MPGISSSERSINNIVITGGKGNWNSKPGTRGKLHGYVKWYLRLVIVFGLFSKFPLSRE
jgi:hypothetical protein